MIGTIVNFMIRSLRRIIPGNSSMKTNYPDSSSGRMIRLFARIYTQTNYQTNYRSLPKFVPDGRSVFSINRAINLFEVLLRQIAQAFSAITLFFSHLVSRE